MRSVQAGARRDHALFPLALDELGGNLSFLGYEQVGIVAFLMQQGGLEHAGVERKLQEARFQQQLGSPARRARSAAGIGSHGGRACGVG